MAEFRITLRRTVTQTLTQLVEAVDEDAVWFDKYEVVTDLSDWVTSDASEQVAVVEAM